eukprot:jgi/Ulvmu1/6938/UM032_0016.1
MNPFYAVTFVFLAACTACLEWFKSTVAPKPYSSNKSFLSFRDNYLFVYCLMMAGDWLQGPYVYALYQHYGYQVGDIGRLFIAGFGSSMIFGTIAGTLADKHGRKLAGLVYVLTYMASCFTKHSPNYWVLMLGRFFGGIATSLLFSAFESWLVSEHMQRGYDEDWLGDTFSRAVMLGNGLIAILAGLLANTLVEPLALGPVAPFDAAAVLLAVGGAIIYATWGENYGNSASSHSLVAQFSEALACIRSDRKVFLLGLMQAVFEGAMYTFVFLWTPALAPNGERIQHGYIFATFMLASMAGSAIAGQALAVGLAPERYMQWVFLLAAACMAVPVAFHTVQEPGAATDDGDPGEITAAGMIQCTAFCVFEVCIGLFWPSMMRMRAHYLPDEMRATLINCFRIPLNLFVCIVLYNVSSYPLSVMFMLCAVFMVVAFLGCHRFEALVKRDSHTGKVGNADSLQA